MRHSNITYGFFICLGCILIPVLQGSIFADIGEQKLGTQNPSAIVVTVDETSVLDNEVVLLGDISLIDAPEMLKEAIAGIEVSSSPKPDKIKSISRRKIASSLKRQKFIPENIIIRCPAQVYVKRAGQHISESEIRDYVLSEVAQRFRTKEYKLISLNIRKMTPYPVGKVVFRMDSDDLTDQNGRISSFVDVYVGGKKEGRLSVSGRLEVYENVLAALNPIRRGTSPGPDDVIYKKQNIFDLNGDAVMDLDELGTAVARISIKQGEYLTSDMFEPVPLVKKGDIVRLLTRNGNLQIITTGVSREDGFADRMIRAENLSSGKSVKGIVRGKSTVEVIY